jgi:bacterioferritin
MTSFLTDITTIRDRARAKMEEGPITDSYGADPKQVVEVLNEALATEIVCVLRYKRHYYMATGIHAEAVAAEFQEHAAQEQAHADLIAARIAQLGGEPDFNPAGLAERSHSTYAEGSSLVSMIREDLVAERIAVDTYGQMIRFIGDRDPTTRVLLEKILAVEEGHAQDLANLLVTLDPTREAE